MKRNRIFFGIALLCIVGGVLLIGGTLLSNIYHYYANQKEIAAYKQEFFSKEEPVDSTKEEQVSLIQNDLRQEDILCILRIPKIDSEELVREGSDKTTLSKGLGHMEGTALPGAIGNFVVAGHRNYTFGRFFNRLDELEIGDEIYVDTIDNIFTYQVTGIEVVTPDQVSILEGDEEQTITLFTCTPIYIATHRLVITGQLMDVEER